MPFHRDVRPQVKFLHLAVAGATAMFLSSLMVCIFLPFLLPFTVIVPFVMIAMAWNLVSDESQLRKAQKLAQTKVKDSQLQIIEEGKECLATTALVLNDWGMVAAAPGQPTRQWAWNEITAVEEHLPGQLTIHGPQGEFKTQPWRFFLLAEVFQDKLPGKVTLDHHPVTGQSYLLERLKSGRNCGDFSMDEQKLGSIPWNAIEKIEEKEIRVEDNLPYVRLDIHGGGQVLEINGDHPAYQLIKSTAAQRLPQKIEVVRPIHDAKERARIEFEWLEEITRPAVIVSRKTKKYTVLKNNFSHMLTLVERYQLTGPLVKKFLKNYAPVLAHDGQFSESERLLALAG